MKECYGKIYPDLQEVSFGQELAGKVFQFRIDTLGSGHRERKTEASLREWQDCQRCEDFRSCYDFSSAKLQLQTFVSAL
jgi:sulfatase maturation enzyme AslB (radical SAM superfamily)